MFPHTDMTLGRASRTALGRLLLLGCGHFGSAFESLDGVQLVVEMGVPRGVHWAQLALEC
jgi:hypothetical protein